MEPPIEIEEKINTIIYNVLVKKAPLSLHLINQFRKKAMKIAPELNFRNDMGADSLDMVILMMEFEKEFNIRLEDNEIENIHTVSQAKVCIRKKVKQKMISRCEILAYKPVRYDDAFISQN